MKPPRTSLAVLIGLVLVAALDLAWFRWFVIAKRSAFGFYPIGMDFGVIPMASVLIVLAAHIAHRRGRVGRFATGFALVGAAGLAAYCTLCWIAPTLMGGLAESAYERTAAWTGVEAWEPTLRRYLPPIPFTYTQIGWLAVLLTIPQAVLAACGGLLFARSRRETRQRGA